MGQQGGDVRAEEKQRAWRVMASREGEGQRERGTEAQRGAPN